MLFHNFVAAISSVQQNNRSFFVPRSSEPATIPLILESSVLRRVEGVLPGIVLGHSIERILVCSAMVEFRAVGISQETVPRPGWIIQRIDTRGKDAQVNTGES
jgi:hypothetical protein